MAGCDDLEDMYDVLNRIVIDSEMFRAFVQGTEYQTVNLGGLDTPTIRRLVSDFLRTQESMFHDFLQTADGHLALSRAEADRAEAEADRARSEAERGAGYADEAGRHAEDAREAAATATNAASNIDGFANATQAFHCLHLGDDGHLYWSKAESGETVRSSDFDSVSSLPAEARLYLNSGRLMLELPFTV